MGTHNAFVTALDSALWAPCWWALVLAGALAAGLVVTALCSVVAVCATGLG